MANGRPERLVASATLASAPSLPQASMTGHVMPAFPHTLIGLGPFADLGCKIVFTKTSVTVFHPDGHPLLSGWRDETGPRLWHFPLTAEAAQTALANASPQPHIPPTAEAAHVAVDSTSHPPQLSIPPTSARSVSRCDPYPKETKMEAAMDTVKSGRWQATPTCIPTPAGHIYSSAPSRRQG